MEQTVRAYLQEITEIKKGASWVVQRVLDACKESADNGQDFTVYQLNNEYVEATVEHLITVCKLDVEITGIFPSITVLEIGWPVEEKVEV